MFVKNTAIFLVTAIIACFTKTYQILIQTTFVYLKTLHFLGMHAINNVRAMGFSWIFPFIPYLCRESTLLLIYFISLQTFSGKLLVHFISLQANFSREIALSKHFSKFNNV